MKLQVIYNYDSIGKVNAKDLMRLIEENEIIAFRRSSGWVRIGTDPVRGAGGEYDGPERRNIIQKALPPPKKGFHYCLLSSQNGDPGRENMRF
jgi:hypothetical protein